MEVIKIYHGLENVPVAATEISDVQGHVGKLIIRGYSVEELAPIISFEGSLHLLWHGTLPTSASEAELRHQLGVAREAVYTHVLSVGHLIFARSGKVDVMDLVRAAVAALPSETEPLAIVATVAMAAVVWNAQRQKQTPKPPDVMLSHATDILRMLSRSDSTPPLTKAFESYLATVADHGMNASTFAARVVASTQSDLVSAVTAAIGALKGPLHGGAPGPVLDMLDQIARPERAEEWLLGELAAKRRIMGMGHRVYKVRDPRAAVLELAIERLEKSGLRTPRLAMARAVEKAAERTLRKRYPDRELHANVEFYTAVLLDAVGIPREVFTAVFAMSRVLGWCAHV